MCQLGFFSDLNPSPLCDLLTANLMSIPPRTPGAYVLLARPGVTFRYPVGESRVFYIGQSIYLRARLKGHRNHITEAMSPRRKCLYRPVGEYGAACGAYYSTILAGPGRDTIELEDQVLARFAQLHRSLPAANGAAGWRRLRLIIDLLTKSPP
jgi:hypothetical protein